MTISKIININSDLEPVKKGNFVETPPPPIKMWERIKCNHYGRYRSDCKCCIMSYMENCVSNTYGPSNSFYGAFVMAYNNHEDVVLSPDDVWMHISLMFSKYINTDTNAKRMQDMFVEGDAKEGEKEGEKEGTKNGKKVLRVETWNERSEGEWNEIFTLMGKKIAANTKHDVYDLLKNDFTTTTNVECAISTAVIMNSFKEYFSYERCIPSCGIKNIQFMGTLDDWTKVRAKTLALKKYSIDNYWAKYIDEILPILDEFIKTYNEDVDVDFWNKIMNTTHGRLGSGSTTLVSGWILKFFGIYREVGTNDIKNFTIDVPVTIDNKITGVIKEVSVLGGFSGINYTDGGYRPQMSMAVFYYGNFD